MQKNKDMVTGAVLAAFSAVYLFFAKDIQVFTGPGRDPLSSKFIPVMFGSLLLVMSVLLLIRGAKQAKAGNGGDAGQSAQFKDVVRQNAEVILTFVALALYLGLMEPLGFIIASILFIVGEALILTPPEKRRDKRMIIIAVIIAVSVSVLANYLFAAVFHVMLPEGLIGF